MENSYDNKKSLKTQAAANNLSSKIIQNKAKELQDNRSASVLQKKANNTGLPENLKSGLENISGHSMDDVKVHYNSGKPAQLQAHAYAQGTDIHIASGQEKHLPHEAWHVVQQKQGRVKPTLQMKGKVNVNDDKGLEKEADVMGAKAMTVQRKENGKAHNAGCGCGSCNTSKNDNKNSDVSSSGVYQLMICGSCHQNNSHAPSCKHYTGPKHASKSKKVKDANIVGGSHNRGGYQKSGAGGDQHQKGFAAAVNVEKKTGFYANVRNAKKKKDK
ncbi:DUF4157 domain-containing protein [Flavobacterium sp. FlaQc-47]|uniref:eCIS core domain-containing protein n=1 Tax=Flavobacterium sp. FlaQc-47 TaxID=3374180 RepID=UPI00375775B2